MKCRKVAWITPSSFVDTDLFIVAGLQNEIEIYWQIVSFGKTSDELKKFIEPKLKFVTNLIVEYVEIPYRFYDLRTMIAYCHVLRKARSYNPDLFYTSLQAAPFGPLIYRVFLPINRTIAACHNVSTPKGANHERYAQVFTFLHLKTFSNIQVFSESQKEALLMKHPNKNVLQTTLTTTDYGASHDETHIFNNDKIAFLFFGNILKYKRLDILLKASQKLYEKGYKNFIVRIAGACKNWGEYEQLIRYPELFELRIERIPNEDVSSLFESSDYFVMPYQDIAQSGAIMVAFNYNLPIFISNLPQFLPYGIDGETCFFFEKENSDDLAKKMELALKKGKDLHDKLQSGQLEFVENNFSTKAICKKYMEFFNNLTK